MIRSVARRVPTDRLAFLHATRLTTVVVLLTFAGLHDQTAVDGGELASVLSAWLALTTVGEVLRRRVQPSSAACITTMVLLDALVVALEVGRAGGPGTPFVLAVYLHVVAVSLLVSYRTGLRVAVFHSLLLFVAHAAGRAGGLGMPPADADDASLAALHATGFVLLAIVVAACSSLNERALRRSRANVAAIAAVDAAMAGLRTEQDVALAVTPVIRSSFGLSRIGLVVDTGDAWFAVRDDGRAVVLFDGPNASGASVVASAAPHRALVADLQHAHPVLGEVLPAARNVVVCPLVIDDAIGGWLLAEHGGRSGARVASTVVATLSQVAARVGVAIRDARLMSTVERLATRDALTGLLNRRVFDELLAAETVRSDRSGLPFSLVVLDVDHFKAVNDTHGHAAGDTVLRHVGAALAGAVRESDIPARLGGEEFVVLLPACDRDDARQVAEVLRVSASVTDGPVPVTLSAGVATYPADAATGDQLFVAADVALYAAKRGGRDQTVAASTGALRLVS